MKGAFEQGIAAIGEGVTSWHRNTARMEGASDASMTRAAAVFAVLALTLAACRPGGGAEASEAYTGEAYTIQAVDDASLGAFLTDGYGHTLYIFKNDGADTSRCTAVCAGLWPSFILAVGASVEGGAGVTGTFGTIRRDDGTTQITYDHAPLYYYSGDAAAGDTKGRGMGDAWFVAPVRGDAGSASPTPSSVRRAECDRLGVTPRPHLLISCRGA